MIYSFSLNSLLSKPSHFLGVPFSLMLEIPFACPVLELNPITMSFLVYSLIFVGALSPPEKVCGSEFQRLLHNPKHLCSALTVDGLFNQVSFWVGSHLLSEILWHCLLAPC